jgi:hypothetical protein
LLNIFLIIQVALAQNCSTGSQGLQERAAGALWGLSVSEVNRYSPLHLFSHREYLLVVDICSEIPLLPAEGIVRK